MEGWTTDKRFRTPQGQAAPLSVGASDAQFKKLVKYYGGDVPASAVLKELKRLKAVRISAGRVRLLKTATRGVTRSSAHFSTSADRIVLAIRGLSLAAPVANVHSYDETIPVRDNVELQMYGRKIDAALSAAFRGIGALKPSDRRRHRAVRRLAEIRVLALVTPQQDQDVRH